MANRIRGAFSNARALSYFVVRIAVAMLGNGAARRYLESPSWGVTESPPEGPLLAVDCEEVLLPGCPFDVLPTSDGESVFVSLHKRGGTQRTAGTVAVMKREGSKLRLQRQISLPAAAWGLALVRNDSRLAVANSHGVALLDTSVALSQGDPVVGVAHYGRDLQTIRVIGSADGRWLFASDEHNRSISILDLDRPDNHGFDESSLVNQIPVDLSPLGMELSLDGKYLYVTCEMSRISAPDLVNWFVWGATLRGDLKRAGVLSTIDVPAATEGSQDAVEACTPAGGHPVRIRRDQSGSLWVTARASNQLIVFGADQPGSPRQLNTVAVGPAPVGLCVLEEIGVILVANSNRFASAGGRETISVIDMAGALKGEPSCLGRIAVGTFPREINVDPRHGVVYVSNFDSENLSVIPIQSIEHAVKLARTGVHGEYQ